MKQTRCQIAADAPGIQSMGPEIGAFKEASAEPSDTREGNRFMNTDRRCYPRIYYY